MATDNPKALALLDVCPMCGGGETRLRENRHPPSMNRPIGEIISTDIDHFCYVGEAALPRVCIRVTGRDTAEAVDAWNRRGEGYPTKSLPCPKDI